MRKLLEVDLRTSLARYVDLDTGQYDHNAFKATNMLFSKSRKYKRIATKILNCRLCKDLNIRGVTSSAPGWGNLNASIMFVGQSLCTQCMSTQIPFTERSGYYIDAVLTLLNLHRRDVFITNVVHCHPPGNRASKDYEIRNCLDYLKAEIKIVEPEIIVSLGKSARLTIEKLKLNCKHLPVQHPASFLYSGKAGVVDWIINLVKELLRYA